jgi:hypothetical protein
VVDARKRRDPRIFFHHQSAADETASVETAARGTTSFKVSVGTAETTPGLKTRSTARCTTALSSNRMQERIFSSYAGGAFHSAEIGRSAPPFSSAVLIRVEDSIIPPPPAHRIFRVVTNHIEQGSRGADAHWFVILRHQPIMTIMTVVTADAGSLCYTLFDAFSTVCS